MLDSILYSATCLSLAVIGYYGMEIAGHLVTRRIRK